MHSALNAELYTNHYSAVEHFQLRKFSFKASTTVCCMHPSTLIPNLMHDDVCNEQTGVAAADTSILTKLIKEQNVQTAAVNQNSTLVRKQTAVIQSQAANDVVCTPNVHLYHRLGIGHSQ
jgi:hypothetical protein